MFGVHKNMPERNKMPVQQLTEVRSGTKLPSRTEGRRIDGKNDQGGTFHAVFKTAQMGGRPRTKSWKLIHQGIEGDPQDTLQLQFGELHHHFGSFPAAKSTTCSRKQPAALQAPSRSETASPSQLGKALQNNPQADVCISLPTESNFHDHSGLSLFICLDIVDLDRRFPKSQALEADARDEARLELLKHWLQFSLSKGGVGS